MKNGTYRYVKKPIESSVAVNYRYSRYKIDMTNSIDNRYGFLNIDYRVSIVYVKNHHFKAELRIRIRPSRKTTRIRIRPDTFMGMTFLISK